MKNAQVQHCEYLKILKWKKKNENFLLKLWLCQVKNIKNKSSQFIEAKKILSWSVLT